jgi:hypothetical protein
VSRGIYYQPPAPQQARPRVVQEGAAPAVPDAPSPSSHVRPLAPIVQAWHDVAWYPAQRRGPATSGTVPLEEFILDWQVTASRASESRDLQLDWEVVGKSDGTTSPDPVLTLDWHVRRQEPIFRLGWDVIGEDLAAAHAEDIQQPIAVATFRQVSE